LRVSRLANAGECSVPHSSRLALTLVTMGCATLAVGEAFAQQAPDNTTVLERPRPDFDPLGIRAGAFMIRPQLGVEGEYNSNVDGAPNNEDDDFGLVLSPALSAQSNWSRHALRAALGSQITFYGDNSDNNYQDVFGDLGGRLDITRDDTLTGGIRVSREHEDRTSSDDLGQEDLTYIFRYQYNLNYRRNFNRFFTTLGGVATRLSYDNDDIDASDRDRWRYGPRVRLGYDISPRVAVFAQGQYDWLRYDSGDTRGVERDSEGYRVSVGTALDFTGILFGEFDIGLERREYDNDNLDNFTGVGGGGTITWNPTRLTSVIFNADLGIEETTVVFQGDTASGNFRKAVGVEVQHELLRNLILIGRVGYENEDFEDTNRTDDTFDAGAGVRYLLNRNLALTANYNFENRSSDDNNQDYTRNIVRIGLLARL
jgi:hypothetical protein